MRRITIALLAALTTLVAVVLGAGDAAAHSDAGVIEVVEANPSEDGGSVDYLVALTYENDGDPVDDAVVTATPELTGVGPQPAITLTATGAGGGYRGTVTFPAPGDWVIRFASAEPEAAAQVTFTRETPNLTAVPPSTTDASDATPPTTTPAADTARLAADDTDTGDDGPPVGLFVAAGAAGLVLVAAVVVALRRRRMDGDADGP